MVVAAAADVVGDSSYPAGLADGWMRHSWVETPTLHGDHLAPGIQYGRLDLGMEYSEHVAPVVPAETDGRRGPYERGARAN